MKWHFGHGVFLVATLFVGFITYMVVNMMGQKVDLVESNYYEKGLRYQDEIDRRQQRRESLILQQSGGELSLGGVASAEELKVLFYRPSDSGLDTSFTVANHQGQDEIRLSPGLAAGFWRVTIRWREGQEDCFQESELVWK